MAVPADLTVESVEGETADRARRPDCDKENRESARQQKKRPETKGEKDRHGRLSYPHCKTGLPPTAPNGPNEPLLALELLDETGRLELMDEARVDERLRIRSRRLGIFRRHVVEQSLDSGRVGIRHIH